MDCQWTRIRIPAHVDGELDEPELSQVCEHLADCEDCAAISRREEQLTHRLRAAAGGETAPSGLRERIQASLSEIAPPAAGPAPATSRPRSHTAWGLLAAAAAVLLVLLAVPWGGTGTQLVSAMAAEHQERVDGDRYHGLELVSQDNTEIEEYLSRQLGTKVKLPAKNVPMKRGARSCERGGVKLGVVGCFCKRRGKAVTIFVARAEGLSMKGLRKIARQNRDFFCGSSGKCRAVLWRRGDLYYALVGDLEADDLLDMARRAADSLDGPKSSKSDGVKSSNCECCAPLRSAQPVA